MSSRHCGIWLLSICWIGLAGCANWQARASHHGTPGSTAMASEIPPSPGGGMDGSSLLAAPGTSFGEPPPPVAPMISEPGMSLGPVGSAAAPEKLNLSAPSEPSPQTARADSSASGKLYNLGGGPKSEKGTASSSSSSHASSSGKSSTIGKLARKSSTSSAAPKESESPAKKTAESQSEPSRKAATRVASESEPASRQGSALERLSREAETDRKSPSSNSSVAQKIEPEAARNADAPLPRPERVNEPAPVNASASASSEAGEDAMDTSLLAQPVRKGSQASERKTDKESKGPQSRVIPHSTILKQMKPVIYPVSNPAVEEPLDITQFS